MAKLTTSSLNSETVSSQITSVVLLKDSFKDDLENDEQEIENEMNKSTNNIDSDCDPATVVAKTMQVQNKITTVQSTDNSKQILALL